jgi:hypothetical protein
MPAHLLRFVSITDRHRHAPLIVIAIIAIITTTTICCYLPSYFRRCRCAGASALHSRPYMYRALPLRHLHPATDLRRVFTAAPSVCLRASQVRASPKCQRSSTAHPAGRRAVPAVRRTNATASSVFRSVNGHLCRRHRRQLLAHRAALRVRDRTSITRVAAHVRRRRRRCRCRRLRHPRPLCRRQLSGPATIQPPRRLCRPHVHHYDGDRSLARERRAAGGRRRAEAHRRHLLCGPTTRATYILYY